MTSNNIFDVIIVGGSYSGLAAAMALGRALKHVLIIDDGEPCNRQTPYSHNFLTNDGKTPAAITAVAVQQVKAYATIKFFNGTARVAYQTGNNFQIRVTSGETFESKRIVFATGIKDILPPIVGLPECWGISVIHCPYCHGYEVRNQKTGILGNGDTAFDFAKLIYNWTKDLTVFTNGPALFLTGQVEMFRQHQVRMVENEIKSLEHSKGQIRNIHFKDGSVCAVDAVYAPAPFEQHCQIPELLGCELTQEGYIKVDGTYETPVKGIYAIGDNASKLRTVANAVAMGTTAGMVISKEMILNAF